MDDPLEQADAILRDYQAWCYKRANQMTVGAFVEDLAQEGLLAMWKALHTWDADKGALPSWLTRHAEWRMRDVVAGQSRQTGNQDSPRPSRGAVPNYVLEQQQTTVVDIRSTPGDTEPRPLLGEPPTPLEDFAVSAYHRGHIVEAINQLPPSQREYVYLRFWKDYRLADMREHFGYDPTSGLWNSPKHGAKRRLQEHLTVLVAA